MSGVTDLLAKNLVEIEKKMDNWKHRITHLKLNLQEDRQELTRRIEKAEFKIIALTDMVKIAKKHVGMTN